MTAHAIPGLGLLEKKRRENKPPGKQRNRFQRFGAAIGEADLSGLSFRTVLSYVPCILEASHQHQGRKLGCHHTNNILNVSLSVGCLAIL